MEKMTRRTALKIGAGWTAGAAIGLPLMAAPGIVLARTRLTLATGGTGGSMYQIGAGMARLMSEKLADTQATAQVTGGSIDNVKLCASGDADFGFSTVDAAYQGYMGQGAFAKEGKQDVRVVITLFDILVHVVASRTSGVRTIADMKGKRISVGSTGSATETIADAVMTAAGLNPQRDITRENIGGNESAAALQDGKIAAFFFVTGVPSSAVRELAQSNRPPLLFVPTDKELAVLRQKFPGLYNPFPLETTAYPNMAQRVPSIGVPNAMITSGKTPNSVVTAALETVFGNLDAVQATHPDARKVTLASAANRVAVPFHPAAEAYYRAKGVLK